MAWAVGWGDGTVPKGTYCGPRGGLCGVMYHAEFPEQKYYRKAVTNSYHVTSYEKPLILTMDPDDFARTSEGIAIASIVLFLAASPCVCALVSLVVVLPLGCRCFKPGMSVMTAWAAYRHEFGEAEQSHDRAEDCEHQLVEQAADPARLGYKYNTGWYCDLCDRYNEPKSTLYRCKDCRVDYCFTCARASGKLRQSA